MSTQPRFQLGQTVATPGALAALDAANQQAQTFFARHHAGDWGEVPPEDAQQNELAVEHGGRLLSAYTLSTDVKIWLITEGDRSVTTILLPQEY